MRTDNPTDAKTKITEMLELSDKNIKAAIIKMQLKTCLKQIF